MSALFLDLRDKRRVINFLIEHLEYSSSQQQVVVQPWIQAYEEGKKVPTDALAEATRKFAADIWPVRYALEHFFATPAGQDKEWRRVVASIRPSTAHVMKRFHLGTAATASLDTTLNHPESEAAFREEERQEISGVRQHLRIDYWRKNKSTLKTLLATGRAELALRQTRLKTLRNLGLDLPRSLQDEVFSKILHYDDRLLFEGELIPLEILDEEIKYYTEQKHLSPLD